MDDGEFKKKEKAAVRGRQHSSQGTSKFPCDARGCRGVEQCRQYPNLEASTEQGKQQLTAAYQHSSTAEPSKWWSFSEEKPH